MIDRLRHSLALRLVLAFSACSVAIFLAIFSVNYYCTRTIVHRQADLHAADVLQAATARIQSKLIAVTVVPKHLAALLEEQDIPVTRLRSILREFVVDDDQVYGASVSFEPAAAGGHERAPYVYENPQGVVFERDLAEGDYGYRTQGWYTTPRDSGSPQWSEPYFDKGGGDVYMTTFAVPFYRVQDGVRRFAGVVTADVSLSWLSTFVSSLHLGGGGYGVLLSRSGRLIAAATKLPGFDSGLAGLLPVGEQRRTGAWGAAPRGAHVVHHRWGNETWIYYDTVPASDWRLAVLFPAREILSDLTRLGLLTLSLCLTGFVTLVLGIVWVSRTVTRPLVSMTGAVQAIAHGNLDASVPDLPGEDEVATLARAFGSMQGDLKRHIAALTEATAARERVESELNVARRIQLDMLPLPMPRHEAGGWDVAARMVPARQVGGDLYDFFALDDGRLFFSIGDVSGKGVPASLYMAVTLALMRQAVHAGAGPAQALQYVNRELARANQNSMFVTLCCGVLDGRTGEVTCASAGHPAPVLVAADGSVTTTPVSSGLVAGIMEAARYTDVRLHIEAGDRLVLTTDGVSEAIGPGGEQMLGDDGLLAALAPARDDCPDALVARVFDAVHAFAAGTPQSDDITVLVVRRAASLT